ncbi:MAG: exosortase system-associated protein, TIGR04073 family [Candidatus Omnitrophota bacterium]
MKKTKVFKISNIMLLAAIMLGFFAPYSFAQDPVKKLCRGALNTATSLIEFPKNIFDTGREDGVGMGVTYGVIKGAFHFARRTIVGLYEIATFPIPMPKDYEPILTDPEYFFGKEEEQTIE